jgi:hypothetical protein
MFMRYLLWSVCLIVLFAMCAPAYAQGGGGRGPGAGKGGGGAPGAGQGRRPGQPPELRRDRDPRRGPQRQADGDHIGWGESGTEDRILPGQVVPDADKDKRLEEEADKLELEDRRKRTAFLRHAKAAWQKTERQDRRFSSIWSRVKNDEERAAEETKKHKDELESIWKECDDRLLKDEILDEGQLRKFQESTEDLREETATEKSHRQDVIRAKREEEVRNGTEWRRALGRETEDGPRRERKEDDED